METFRILIVLIWSIIWQVNCVPRRRIKCENIQKINRITGEATAVDKLIQIYEREHRKFYEEEIGDGDHLEWPTLENKDLSSYCRNYLQHLVPKRRNDNTVGLTTRKELKYNIENISSNSVIIIVHCKIKMRRTMSFYITKAPEPNCVYALKCSYRKSERTLCTIIHKHCDFEETSLNWKKRDIVGKIHKYSRQPIAKDKYLLEYEMEHQELVKREGVHGKGIKWPHAILHNNLDSYCYQFMEKFAPNRNWECITGNWEPRKLHYQKLPSNEDIEVTIVICLPNDSNRHRYYLTRAPETNCVYALLRMGCTAYSPFVIGFKHCDIENPNDQQTTSQDHNVCKNVIPRTVLKEEILDTLDTLQLLSTN